MCGLVGLVSSHPFGEEIENSLKKMADAIIHRGPDDQGIWIDYEQKVALAHNRLSIVDLSKLGSQPMQSFCSRYLVAYNGEIYNHQELRKELFDSGFGSFRGYSDTEVLLALISTKGLKGALEKIEGMFAFALWDKKVNQLFLVRDRMGEKPLYFGEVGSDFVFASELAALYLHPNWQGKINRNSLTLLMRHNCIPSPHSIFSNIFKLEPGKILNYNPKTKKSQSEYYWNPNEIYQKAISNPFLGTSQDAVDETEKKLIHSISNQMVADVPLGAFLSGGIDSSTVVALMQSISNQPIETFTIGFNQREFNEATYASKIAIHLGTSHRELYLDEKDLLDVIPKIPLIYSEPFADSSQIPTYLVAKLARKSVTVSLSGDGGDELFSGYSRYDFIDDYYSKFNKIPIWMRKLAHHLIQSVSPQVAAKMVSPFSKLLAKKYQFVNLEHKIDKFAGVLNHFEENEIYRYFCSHWQNPSQLVLRANEPETKLTSLKKIPNFSSFIQKMMYLDTQSYLPDDILTKVDRASMAVSLESRIPMLNHQIVEFAASLPIEILRKNNQSKWLLKQILYKYIPKDLVERPKMGFGVPIRDWLRGPLKDWGEDLLNQSKLEQQGYFDAAMVRNAWQDHQSKKKNMEYLLWDVLMFQAWLEHYDQYVSSR